MDYLLFTVLFMALILALFSIHSTGRMAREAMRRQADMERLLVVAKLSENPMTQPMVGVVASLGRTAEPEPPKLVRTPIAQAGPGQDPYGYDLPESLES